MVAGYFQWNLISPNVLPRKEFTSVATTRVVTIDYYHMFQQWKKLQQRSLELQHYPDLNFVKCINIYLGPTECFCKV